MGHDGILYSQERQSNTEDGNKWYQRKSIVCP